MVELFSKTEPKMFGFRTHLGGVAGRP